MDNIKITTSELDFDAIKTSLRTYLQEQSQFQDYDFEGSALSTLLDILAVNTHYNALYTNLAVNEVFIDSASKRMSVVSRANELGYTPRSARCATAVVDVTMINTQIGAPTTIEIPAYTAFSGQIAGKPYTFYTTSSYVATRNDTSYEFAGVELKEGSVLTYSYTVGDSSTFTIPNLGVDTTTLLVTVQENAETSTFDVYQLSDTIVNIDGTSPVYYIREIENEKYQLQFGNGVVGKALTAGNVVTVTYMVGNKELPNGIASFTYNGSSIVDTEVFVTTVTSAVGGAEAEDIDSIRVNAPRTYTAQNRCVTIDDYKTAIMALFSNISAINVWGGDKSTPPQYGKVFITIIPKDTATLTDDEKDYILDTILAPRKSLTVTPEFVDPTYIRISLDIAVYYNPQHTTRSASDIASLVQQTVVDYNNNNLNTFFSPSHNLSYGGVFKYSQLSRAIDATEHSITSNITTIALSRDLTPVYNVLYPYTIELGNPIYNSGVPEESFKTTGFYNTYSNEVCYIDDLPVESNDIGSLRLFYYNTSGEKVILRTIGSINYATGTVNIDSLIITSLYGESWSATIKPQSNDVVSVNNQFVQIDTSAVTITPIADYPLKPYTFTSSRN